MPYSTNVRDEQRKFIKYNDVVANIVAFHNVVSMTKAIDRLKAQGQQISDDVLAAVSPHISTDSAGTNCIRGGHRNRCHLFGSRHNPRRVPE